MWRISRSIIETASHLQRWVELLQTAYHEPVETIPGDGAYEATDVIALAVPAAGISQQG